MPPGVIDTVILGELQAAAGKEFVDDLLVTFSEEAPQLLDELRSALAAGSAERFRRAAHSLKSNAMTFGALAFTARARELELHGLPADGAGIDALQNECVRAMETLKALCHG
jgi:HPt (histidine-containing phosphotransfer) domain-containing protein